MASSTPVDRYPSIPTLTCESCRQRKIKCDKLNPCTNCQKAGIDCESVRRRRLPRGRHINKSTGNSHNLHLQNKIDRLEALVNVALAGSPDTPNTNTPTSNGTSPRGVTDGSSTAGNNATMDSNSATQLWANLIKQVHGPPDFTSEHVSGEDKKKEAISSAENDTQSSFTGFSPGLLGSAQLHSLSLRPTPPVTAALCNVYLDQVDRIIKILHRPSLKGRLIDGTSYSSSRSSITAENALDAAVFYAAVASMTDRQCQSLFHCNKVTVLPEYQRACEMSLERADLTRTRDVTVLQAFILYLVATRAHDKSRAVWTLVATAVRLAHTLNLHVEFLHPSETFFGRQMRKRLWLTICLLDMQTCIEPDTKPLIPLDMVHTSRPFNLNDSDFDLSHPDRVPTERDGVTDMTFALITYRLQTLGRGMYRIKLDKKFEATREDLVKTFENDVHQHTGSCNPDENAYSWFIYHGSRSLIASAQLFTMGSISETPYSTQMPCSVLGLCANAIENVSRVQNDERGEGFRWYVTPQWPAVALAVRECYVSTDFATIKRVWPLIEEVFERYQNANASVNGRPRSEMLRKLMDTTRERVHRLISENSVSASETLDSPLAEAFSETQATNLASPSWAEWESFMNELCSGHWTLDNPDDLDGNFCIEPDLIFPFT